MRIPNIIKLVLSLAIPLAVGAIAGAFTAEAIPEWYTFLNKPSFNPPNWLFAPVWTTLYIIMGISFFMVWKQAPGRVRNIAMISFALQLFLNFGWSFFFFYFKTIGFALVEIILLWGSILFMLLRFYRINPLTAYLNIPYILWVSFATLLNAAYYFLN